MNAVTQETVENRVQSYLHILNDIAPEGYHFDQETGRKYTKIIMVARGDRSVHAFVDRNTGDVYKPASWKAPAKGVRYNLVAGINQIASRADWAGGYLYR